MPASNNPGRAAALMVQGTGSDVGKSLMVAGLCRAYARRGLRVAPFKPQNMSNNAAVTIEGGEIGRAQALQARACGLTPSIHMNPVLLKPQTDVGAQVVVRGQVRGNATASDYRTLKPELLPEVLDSFHLLSADRDLVIVEGAGSPAEVNLRAGDIANMGFAEAADLPVLLVGDVDRGGVIASIVGTHILLTESERARLIGYAINKFRGDIRLFDGALDVIAERTGLRSFGVLPYLEAARRLPREDSASLDADAGSRRDGPVVIAVPRLPRIANFDDLDPLAAEPDVDLRIVEPGNALPGNARVILIPGSKATASDLAFLRAQEWDVDIKAHLRRGGLVVGLCGGYQMLGRVVHDFDGVEGSPGSVMGLGLLDVETTITGNKTLREASGVEFSSGLPVRGYEMHVGVTEGPGRANEWLELHVCDGDEDVRPEGAVSVDGRVMGSYLHGLFASDDFRRGFLDRLNPGRESGTAFEAEVESALDALADHVEAFVDLDGVLDAAKGWRAA